jgi:hypothetical protein
LALQSPLLLGGKVTITDLRLAVLVCSTSSNKEFFKASTFKSLYWRVWKKFTAYFPVTESLHTFNVYIDDYIPDFPFWSTDTSESEKVPGFFISAARLLVSCSPDEIMNMPLGEVLAWNLAKNETEPVLEPNKNLMTDSEVQILRDNPAFMEAV